MANLTGAYDARRKDGQLIGYPMNTFTTYKGALVMCNSSGQVSPAGDTAGYNFVGVAYESLVAPIPAGSLLRVQKEGVFVYNKAAAALADIGKVALVVDDNTVSTAATTNNLACGYVVGVIDGSHVAVRIDNKAN